MDTSGNIKIVVEKTHTDEMIKNEVRAMLGAGSFNVTLGMLEVLWLIDSPYIKGGDINAEDLEQAFNLIPHEKNLEPLDFHNALIDALETAWRAYEIVEPDDDPLDNRKVSEIEIFSPEWIADTISSACKAMPSLTYTQILWEIPLTMILHLSISTARSNGVLTRRPDDTKEALKQLKKINAEKRRLK